MSDETVQTATDADASTAKDAPTADASADEATRARRKIRTGVVTSDRMDKTIVVRIDTSVRHPLYRKTVRRSSKLKAHDEGNQAHVGDKVRIMETRPLSATKRWRLIEIVERAK